MANLIPFEKLEVGKVYWIQSRYWHEVFEVAYELTEVDIYSGSGWVKPTDGSSDGFRIEADWDWFWDARPDKDEEWNQALNYKLYRPPRKIEGVVYHGGEIDSKLAKKLDELIAYLQSTFIYDPRFKQNKKDPNSFFIWESKLNCNLSEYLIRGNGQCDWEVISYIEKNSNGFNIHAGERDGFGWLTGCIDWQVGPNKKMTICYG